ncbi:MAG: aminotransferase class V-fold PLP-dependent enzyme [Bacteroidia bacterium]
MESSLKHAALLDLESIRKDFPILSRTVNNKPLVYLDNGATTQKPLSVIESGRDYYTRLNSNIHRGVHRLSQDVTALYEQARQSVQKHLHALHAHEIIFTKGTTDSICLVAHSFGKKYIRSGDEILITEMEHHSNILPWQQFCENNGAVLRVVPVCEDGTLDLTALDLLLNPKTKLFAFTHVSNTLGTINPAREMIALAHSRNIAVLVDGAQAVPHMPVNVRELDADFYCFSGHKVFGPTGVGILYGKEKWLNEMPPYQVGGGTIKTVTFRKTEYADLPLRFEAGTPNIEGGLGLAKALDYINLIGMERIASYEHELLLYATRKLNSIAGIRIIGKAKEKASVLSFIADGIHPNDIGTLLDQQGIAVRTGHHCTQPLMQHYNIPGTVRASFAFYNTRAEIDLLETATRKAVKMLG